MMDWNKQEIIAQYLAQHENEFHAVERLNWPRVLTFETINLPHNQILDDEFWATLGSIKKINIAHQPDNTWELGL